jgi:hypothetical protein
MKTVTNVHLKTAGEGQFLKAYLAYLAGWREIEPSPPQFNLQFRLDRVRIIKSYANSLVEALRSE